MTYWTSMLHKASMVSLIFCASFVLLVGYWLTRPYDLFQIKSLTVIDREVEVGEFLEYQIDYCKSPELARAAVQISFRDGVIYNLPVESGPLAPGCGTATFVLPVPIIPEGVYRLEMSREYAVNPLRKIEVHAVSGPFRVSGKQRLTELLKKQLPEVLPQAIHEAAPKIQELK